MENENLPENAGNQKVFFIKFLPDDYHGEPEIDTIFPPDRFPVMSTYDEIFEAWCRAGYNAYSYREEEEDYDEDADENPDTERRYFDLYGDMPMYYSIYMVLADNESVFDSVAEHLSDFSEYGERKVSVEECVGILKDINGISFVLPITSGLQNQK